jgi:hypothetical protein
MPFPVIADPDARLAAALGLPTFEIGGLTLYKRSPSSPRMLAS